MDMASPSIALRNDSIISLSDRKDGPEQPQNEREIMLQKMQGQVVRIPDLRLSMAVWPRHINPHRETIKTAIDDILESYSMSAAMTEKLKRANLDYLLAVWYPYATEAKLKDLTYFCGWMFLVDDEIDGISGPGVDNEKAFADLCRDTIGIVERSLDLGGEVAPEDLRRVNATAESFGRIGEALSEHCSANQRQMFLDEARLTLEGYRCEQQFRLRRKIPTLEEYWNYRQGSSCIRQVVAMIEFANNLHISDEIMQSTEMRSLWTETCLVHWITNDIVSAKKEIAGSFIENLVVLCSGPTGSAQAGMDTAVRLLQESIARLETAASKLMSRYGCNDEKWSETEHDLAPKLRELERNKDYSEVELSRVIKLFIANCRCMCIGCLEWSISSPRYGLQDIHRDAEGGIAFVLGL